MLAYHAQLNYKAMFFNKKKPKTFTSQRYSRMHQIKYANTTVTIGRRGSGIWGRAPPDVTIVEGKFVVDLVEGAKVNGATPGIPVIVAATVGDLVEGNFVGELKGAEVNGATPGIPVLVAATVGDLVEGNFVGELEGAEVNGATPGIPVLVAATVGAALGDATVAGTPVVGKMPPRKPVGALVFGKAELPPGDLRLKPKSPLACQSRLCTATR
jgi:hypothetical protein